MSLICAFPLCRYILNAGLYDRAKVLIPSIPLMLFMVALFVKDIINENGRSIVVVEIATGVKIKVDKSSIYADASLNAPQK